MFSHLFHNSGYAKRPRYPVSVPGSLFLPSCLLSHAGERERRRLFLRHARQRERHRRGTFPLPALAVQPGEEGHRALPLRPGGLREPLFRIPRRQIENVFLPLSQIQPVDIRQDLFLLGAGDRLPVCVHVGLHASDGLPGLQRCPKPDARRGAAPELRHAVFAEDGPQSRQLLLLAQAAFRDGPAPLAVAHAAFARLRFQRRQPLLERQRRLRAQPRPLQLFIGPGPGLRLAPIAQV